MYKQKLRDYFDAHMEEILKDLSEIIAIPSVATETTDVKPFGEYSKKALEWGRNKLDELGMATKNIDDYAVHGDYFSEGEPVLAVLSHLDVVPAGDGWHSDPFKLDIRDDTLYGRGTIDDKGPSVAVIWAAKAIRELDIPVNKNFRVIFGGNEENGCLDMEYYEKKVGFPEMLFTPDGSFPVLNCEKGMVHLTFSAPLDDDNIKEISSNKTINAIPDKCAVTYKNDEVSYNGRPAHGSRPENGDNAVTKFLADYKGGSALLKALAAMFPHGEYDGKTIGLGFSDDVSGVMTCALTCLNTENGRLTGGIDIRFPIDRTYEEISGIITKALENAGFATDECSGMEPHYVSADSPFVRTLLDVYEDVKGERGEPVAEGGITYVHNTEGGVAFGAEFPWENNNMHGIDEHISLETFRYNLNMYANAIARLCR